MTILRTTAVIATLIALLVTTPVLTTWAQTETREHHIFTKVQETKDRYTQTGVHPTPPGWDAVALTQKILEEERILNVVYDDMQLWVKTMQEIADLESQVPDSEQRSDISKMMDLFRD